jgi:hypothetical protein
MPGRNVSFVPKAPGDALPPGDLTSLLTGWLHALVVGCWLLLRTLRCWLLSVVGFWSVSFQQKATHFGLFTLHQLRCFPVLFHQYVHTLFEQSLPCEAPLVGPLIGQG